MFSAMAQTNFFIVMLSISVHCTFGLPSSVPWRGLSCDNNPCIAGQECFLKATNCSNPPCPLFASCRPSCDIIRCASGTYCVNGKCVTSCDQVDCAPGERCVLENVNCFVPPCPPIPTCLPFDKCSIVRCRSGYSCYNGRCYKEPTCEGFNCGNQEECYLQNVTCIRAPCFPVPACRPILTCATINCITGYVCVDNKCIPQPTCEGFNCAEDEECYLEDVVCVKAPCLPVPTCRPKLTCATIDCRSGFICVDNKCILPPTCEGFQCGPGQQCYLESVECITAPCPPPQPVCRESCAIILCPPQSNCINGQCIPIAPRRRNPVFFYLNN